MVEKRVREKRILRLKPSRPRFILALDGFKVSFSETLMVSPNVEIRASKYVPPRCGGEKNLNTKNLVIVGVIAGIVLLAASQAFAAPYYYGWGSRNQPPTSTMGSMNGHMSNGVCNMMNGQGMMGSMMNRQSMDYQECQEHMGQNGSRMMNPQYHQQQCQQRMGPDHNMTEQQCQAMYE